MKGTEESHGEIEHGNSAHHPAREFSDVLTDNRIVPCGSRCTEERSGRELKALRRAQNTSFAEGPGDLEIPRRPVFDKACACPRSRRRPAFSIGIRCLQVTRRPTASLTPTQRLPPGLETLRNRDHPCPGLPPLSTRVGDTASPVAGSAAHDRRTLSRWGRQETNGKYICDCPRSAISDGAPCREFTRQKPRRTPRGRGSAFALIGRSTAQRCHTIAQHRDFDGS